MEELLENPITKLLRPYVNSILASMDQGSKKAAEVIRLYELHRCCPQDPGAAGLCKSAFHEWKKEQEGEDGFS